MTDLAWVEAAIRCWRASTRIPPSRWFKVHSTELMGWANRLVDREDRDQAAHHVNTLGIYAQAETPGDPLPGFRKAVNAYLRDLGNVPLNSLTRPLSDDRPQDGVQGGPYARSCNSEALNEDVKMAKKAPAKGGKPSADGDVLDIPVAFRGFSGGVSGTLRLAVAIDEKQITEKQCRHYLKKARLEVELTADPNGGADVEGQDKLLDDDTPRIKSVADVTGYSNGSRISTGLVFSSDSITLEQLQQLSGHNGRLRATFLGEVESKRGRKAKAAASDDQAEFEGGE